MAARELLGLNRNPLSAPRLLMVVINGTFSGSPCNMKILSEASYTDPNFICTGKKKLQQMRFFFSISLDKNEVHLLFLGCATIHIPVYIWLYVQKGKQYCSTPRRATNEQFNFCLECLLSRWLSETGHCSMLLLSNHAIITMTLLTEITSIIGEPSVASLELNPLFITNLPHKCIQY